MHIRVYTVMDRVYWALSGQLDQNLERHELLGGNFQMFDGEGATSHLANAVGEACRVLSARAHGHADAV